VGAVAAAGTGKEADKFRLVVPQVTQPKGGGAIHGIGEKYATNPVNGTASLKVPVTISPGRGAITPEISLSYDSGAGNGIFGLGWHADLPSITRKTDRGLPRYADSADSDVFQFAGAEDLVPELELAAGEWKRRETVRTLHGTPCRVRRYRPRIESGFVRIECWSPLRDPAETCWRTIDPNNLTTWYGRTAESRICDPADPTRIFSWLVCEAHDDKGNAAAYRYKAETSDAVDPTAANERHRTASGRSANRYPKRILYGNRTPYFPDPAAAAPAALPADWCFELVFDYGDHDPAKPLPDEPGAIWPCRPDPFSVYRAGFEVRTYRLCRRILMFHHFPAASKVGKDCLVSSTDLTYRHDAAPADPRNPVHAFVASIASTGYRRSGAGYLSRSLPPLEFTYSEAMISREVRDLDPGSLAGLPEGLDGARYQWVDLNGEGLSGILHEHAGGWLYKRNLSPLSPPIGSDPSPAARFAAPVSVDPIPSMSAGRRQLLDLDGNGMIDLVLLDDAAPGFYARTHDGGWKPFHAFSSRPNIDWGNSGLKFVDLTGDGRADLLFDEDDAFLWYESLGADGFAAPALGDKELDEDAGPRIVFADGTDSIMLGDMAGDGLTGIVRIRNGEVSYWPSLGYGRFGAKVSMDNAPVFCRPDEFDARHVRLADIDGSGTADIVYFSSAGTQIYFNQSGNSWSAGQTLAHFPPVDTASAVMTVDLLGTGTICMVWSSSLPGAAPGKMRYVDLMGGVKPHLLTGYVNNLGAETRIEYAPSTRFYLADEMAGRPWITRLPFPVHVVERTHLYDHVGKRRFDTRHAYHHGYFDGAEREFRGFGMVEQWDSEMFAAVAGDDSFPDPVNIEAASHVPPVLTRTWYHTGIYLGRDRVSRFFAGLRDARDPGEYYREPALTDAQARALLLDDTILPDRLTVEEEREAARALKGAMLRNEVYGLDGSDREPHPYLVTERNLTLEQVQPKAGERHAVFSQHVREQLSYHYERDPADPRILHEMTLAVDGFGNPTRTLSAAYGRRTADPALNPDDQARQSRPLVTYKRSAFTIPVDNADSYRAPMPADVATFELSGFVPAGRFTFAEWTGANFARFELAPEIAYETAPTAGLEQRRPIERVVTRYRKNDLSGDLGATQIESLGLIAQSYKLALTPGLLDLYTRSPGPARNLLPATAVLSSRAGDGGGYVDLLSDGHWWIPSGRTFYDSLADPGDVATTAAAERSRAKAHFFQGRKYIDAFGNATRVDFDADDLLVIGTLDAVGNVSAADQDYRVLLPARMTDPNGNRTDLVYDVHGRLAGVAVRGKAAEALGDTLTGFDPDPSPAQLDALIAAADPRTAAAAFLAGASRCFLADTGRFHRTRSAAPSAPGQWLPAYNISIAREIHVSDLAAGELSPLTISFGFSDGFAREIQRKMQAEPGPLIPGGATVAPRWAGTGWTIFDNKGAPVRQYEPFFTASPDFEFAVSAGTSPIQFYDPVGRAIATLQPDHSWTKTVPGAWRNESWDAGDTLLISDPAADPDVGGHFARLPQAEYLPGWYDERASGGKGPREKAAAEKAAIHAATPAIAHLDPLARIFLDVQHNRYRVGTDPPVDEHHSTRSDTDIEGNQREITDARGNRTMLYAYDLVGRHLYSRSADSGEIWSLPDASDHVIRAWDARGQDFRNIFDALRREAERRVVSGGGGEAVAVRTSYGEGRPSPEVSNLRGRAYRVFDQAGTHTTAAYDFKGNAVRSERQFATDYKNLLDWSGAIALDAAIHVATARFDALNRPHIFSEADGSIVHQGYNEAGLLETVAVDLRGAGALTSFVDQIDYDAKGRRARIVYGGATNTATDYGYDPKTSKLVRLTTTRAGFAADGQLVQDLSYVYDPLGNIMSIRDDAQQTIYFRNKRVEPSTSYDYDALSRLIESSGREHLGQSGGHPAPPTAPDAFNSFHAGLLHPGDGNAMGLYVERYAYDAAGNILNMRHIGADPAAPGWRRCYQYATGSNRLLSTSNPALPHDPALACGTSYAPAPIYGEQYAYDGHGNVTAMPHLANMIWDYHDELRSTARQVSAGVTETSWYVYDSHGQRVRKITERATGAVKNDRLYVGRTEFYRQTGADALFRETLHVMDAQRRIALVETRTDGAVPEQLVRYHLGNHLGSAVLELDDAAAIISYEEYFPFGSTSYRAVRSHTEASRRYRYSGKERDEENGFYYHGARYYAPWLGRWISPDLETANGWNLYVYVGNRPITLVDPDGRQHAPPAGGGVGAPGFWEGMIPIWGSGRDAVHNFQEGKIGWGLGYTALAVTDVFLVKSLITAGGKLVVKGGARVFLSTAAKEAAELAAKDAAEKAAKETAAKLAQQAAETAAKDAAAQAAKDAAEKAVKEAAEKAAADRASANAGKQAAEKTAQKTGEKGGEKAAEKVALDANALMNGLEKGELAAIDAAIAGRTPTISITAAKEFLKKGDVNILRKFLAERGGHIGKAATKAEIDALQAQAKVLGRALRAKDAAVAGSAINEGATLLTRDDKLFRFLKAVGVAVSKY
jgi:RHS repeat-associated protein